MIAKLSNKRQKSAQASVARSIASIVSGSPERAAVSHVVEVSHRLALSYLIRKVHYGNLRLQVFGLELDDLALDCIAELFQRGDNGRFHLFEKYFDDDVQHLDARVALRRLVFSKVNENLFRRYHDADANLSRIIRNIKDGVKADDRLQIVRCRGQQWVAVTGARKNGAEGFSASSDEFESSFHLDEPIAPPEILEAWFTPHLSRTTRVRDLLDRFVIFVDRHPYYARGYGVVPVAQVMRSAYTRLEAEEGEHNEDVLLHPYEIERAVHLVTERLMAEKWDTYVASKKVSQSTYEAYLMAIRTILTDQYLYDAPPESYFSALGEYLPDLTESSYLQEHRNILEYLAKLARTRLLRYLRESIS